MYLSDLHSMKELELNESYCQIATTYDFDYTAPLYKYEFCENSMNIYSREPIAILLDAILTLLNSNHLNNKQDVESLWKILNTKCSSETNKQLTYGAAFTMVDSYVTCKELIQSICYDIIFQQFDAALVVRAKKDLREIIEKRQQFLLDP